MDWLTGYLEQFTYLGIALSLFLAGLGVPIPEDIPLIFGGAMAGAGKINVWIHFGLSMAFILIGDSCLYFIGRRVGRSSETGGIAGRLLTPARRLKVGGYYQRFGNWTVFFGRFVAGIRGAIFLTAGVVEFPFWRFVLLDFLAALVSVPVWIWLGWTFGENWEQIIETAKSAQGWVLLALGAAAVAGFVLYKIFKRRRAASEEAAAEAMSLKRATDHARQVGEARDAAQDQGAADQGAADQGAADQGAADQRSAE